MIRRHCKDQLLPNMAKQPLATPYKRIALRMFTVSPAPNTRLPMISRLIRGLIGRIACILGSGTHHIIEAVPIYRDGSSLNRPNHLWLAHIALHPSMLQKSNLKELSCPPPAYSEHISYFQQKMRSWIRNLKRQFDEITIVRFAQQAFRAKHSVLKAVCVCGSKVWWIYSAHNNDWAGFCRFEIVWVRIKVFVSEEPSWYNLKGTKPRRVWICLKTDFELDVQNQTLISKTLIIFHSVSYLRPVFTLCISIRACFNLSVVWLRMHRMHSMTFMI